MFLVSCYCCRWYWVCCSSCRWRYCRRYLSRKAHGSLTRMSEQSPLFLLRDVIFVTIMGIYGKSYGFLIMVIAQNPLTRIQFPIV